MLLPDYLRLLPRVTDEDRSDIQISFPTALTHTLIHQKKEVEHPFLYTALQKTLRSSY